jgi:hypothetical protein
MTVCPGMRYTVFAGDGCDDELPVVEVSMGATLTLTQCDERYAFFGPATCQLMDLKQYCGASAFVCTYTTHIEVLSITNAVSISWGEGNELGSPLVADLTTDVDLFGSGRMKLHLFQLDSWNSIAPCGYMDYYQHDVSSGQFLEFVRVDAEDLRPGEPRRYTSRFVPSQRGGSYVLALVKSREYLWYVTVLAQSEVLELPGTEPQVRITLMSFNRDEPLRGSWESQTPSSTGDQLVIYRVNKQGAATLATHHTQPSSSSPAAPACRLTLCGVSCWVPTGVCNKNLIMWSVLVEEGQQSGDFYTDGEPTTPLSCRIIFIFYWVFQGPKMTAPTTTPTRTAGASSSPTTAPMTSSRSAT